MKGRYVLASPCMGQSDCDLCLRELVRCYIQARVSSLVLRDKDDFVCTKVRREKCKKGEGTDTGHASCVRSSDFCAGVTYVLPRCSSNQF